MDNIKDAGAFHTVLFFPSADFTSFPASNNSVNLLIPEGKLVFSLLLSGRSDHMVDYRAATLELEGTQDLAHFSRLDDHFHWLKPSCHCLIPHAVAILTAVFTSVFLLC